MGSHLTDANRKNFEELAKRFEKNEIGVAQLLEAYSPGIEPDPEEEFHRAIHRINVKYQCTFEENEGDGEDDR